jgi:hypothetical protein
MGTVNDAIFANRIGHFYQAIAQRLGDFVHTHIGILPKESIDALSADQTQIITYANTFFSLSDEIAFDQSDIYFKGVSDSIDTINEAIKKMDNINRTITISAGVITLAAAIVSQNGGGIVSSLQTIVTAAKG